MTGIVEKNDILELLEDWNFWKKDLPCGKTRTGYLEKLERLSKSGQITVVTGARRSGKSYIMRQFAKSLIEKGLPKNETLTINFDDPRITEPTTKTLQEIFETYLETLNPEKKPFVFLDEVQGVNEWEKWAKTIHELGKANLVVSGSNAKLLSKELATLLTGRHLDLEVFPLSFKEFLSFKGVEIKDELDAVAKRIPAKRLLSEYLEWGGFPLITLAEEKKESLLEYFEDVLDKDVIKRHKTRKGGKLKAIAKFYLTNIANPITFNSLEKSFEVTADTIEKFSTHLQDAYLVFFLKRFSFKTKEQEKSPRKVYSIDCGLANAVGFRFSENTGRLAENAAFLHLRQKPGVELFYWKDALGSEVDFVAKKGAKLELFQVCWNPSDMLTKKRETNALAKAMKELGKPRKTTITATIITGGYEGTEKIKGNPVKFTPLWKWLLE